MAEIVVAVANDVGQKWTINSFTGYVGSSYGAATVRGLDAGAYTITWDTVPGYDPPTFVDGPIVLGESDTHTFESPAYTPVATNLTAIWANDGADKVTQEELRGTLGSPMNHAWDGTKIIAKGARNEVASFSIYLESQVEDAVNITVSFDQLNRVGGGGSITSAPRTTAELYDWAGSNIELFYTRYLQIRGLSIVSYDGQYYDERHVPKRLRRTGWTLTGVPPRGTPDPGNLLWEDRPDADEYYPDILIPIEAQEAVHDGGTGQFDVTAGTTQQIWCDIYIPKGTAAGTYTGNVSISENGGAPQLVPVELTVYDFELSDTNAANAMVFIGDYQINLRHFNVNYPLGSAEAATTRDNYVKLLHRHRFSVVGDERGNDISWPYETLPAAWTPRLDGTLFSDAENYDGPGKDIGNGLYSIGQYADWRTSWASDTTTNKPTRGELQSKLTAWASYMDTNHPGVERFCYIGDEPYKPRGLWSASNVFGGNPPADGFTVSSPAKDGTRTFRIHKDAIGIYQDNAGDSLQYLLATNFVIFQRSDSPHTQYAVYELTADATADGDVRVITASPWQFDDIDTGARSQVGGDASFGVGEEWHISAGSRYSLYYFDIERMANWASTTGIKTISTIPWANALQPWGTPSVTHPANPGAWQSAAQAESTYNTLSADSNRLLICYNGRRPLIGSFATEDDGVALMTIPVAQYRLGIDHWFKWESTYYLNYTPNPDVHNDVFDVALTWGQYTGDHPSRGETNAPASDVGGAYGNGNGVLVYPGTDVQQPDDSYGVNGGFASIRLKQWRAGMEIVEYAVAAKLAQPGQAAAVDAIIASLCPSALWEIGVATEDDPGYQYADISWDEEPSVWNDARIALAAIAEGP